MIQNIYIKKVFLSGAVSTGFLAICSLVIATAIVIDMTKAVIACLMVCCPLIAVYLAVNVFKSVKFNENK